MSMMHYIAANRELPLGESGGKKLRDVDESRHKVKAIRFQRMEQPEGSVPLDQIIDLSDIKEEETVVYETLEDAAGIYVQEIEPRAEIVRKQFKNRYVYQLSSGFGDFFLNKDLQTLYPDRFAANRKCLKELFDYIGRNIGDHEEIELYTCWYGEEEEEKNQALTAAVDLKTFSLGNDFKFSDRQYITFSMQNE